MDGSPPPGRRSAEHPPICGRNTDPLPKGRLAHGEVPQRNRRTRPSGRDGTYGFNGTERSLEETSTGRTPPRKRSSLPRQGGCSWPGRHRPTRLDQPGRHHLGRFDLPGVAVGPAQAVLRGGRDDGGPLDSAGRDGNPRLGPLRAGPQVVTGLVVNDGVNLPRSTRRWLRAVAHRARLIRPTSSGAGGPPSGAARKQPTLTPAQWEGWSAMESMIARQRQDDR